MKFRAPPPKEHCFEFSAPKEATVDDIIDGIYMTVGPEGLRALQHQGAFRFCAAVASAAAAEKVNVAGDFKILGKTCPVTCVGPQIVFMTALRLKLFISNDDLAAALTPYGRVISVHDQTFKGHPKVDNGIRGIKMEMRKPVPNFIFVRGCKVQMEYRGVKRVCSRCGQPGHNRGDCQALWCDRCQAFGHEAEHCIAECRKCGGHHPTADCLKPRSYAAALDEFPALPGGAAEKPGVSDDPDNEVEGFQAGRENPDDDDDDNEDDDDNFSFSLDDVSSPLSPFGESDSVTESSAEHTAEPPAVREPQPTSQGLQTTATTTPLPPRGRGVPSRISAKAAKPASPGASASGLPATPPSKANSASRPSETLATEPPDSGALAHASVVAPTADVQDMDLSKDPAKRGPPSSGESDSAKDCSKKPRPT